MPEFDNATPRFNLPFLFAGQSQREFYVNEAHALTDALLHCAIEGETASPPATPEEGETWLVADEASGAWADQDGKIASRIGGNWVFIVPVDGLRALDKSSGQEIRFASTWRRPETPAAPTGGTTVDSQARTAIAALVDALTEAGVFAEP